MNGLFFQWKLTLLKLGLALGVFTICRVLFWLFNAGLFEDASVDLLLYGLRFDLSALGWLFFPFVILSGLPLPFYFHRAYQQVLRVFFYLPLVTAVVLNGIDWAYFPFSKKRSGIEMFKLLGGGEDLGALLPVFVMDFWYIIVVIILLIVAAGAVYERISKGTPPVFSTGSRYYIFGFLFFGIAVVLNGIAARGGLQLSPLSPVDAGIYAPAENTPVVLNTPFVMLRGLNREVPPKFEFMPQREAERLFSRRRYFGSDQKPEKNIVILILEGFSKEHIGFLNEYEGYTPYLDKILQRSLVFENAFANGQKSIEAVPAVLAGVPSLMNTPYIQSSYSTNSIFSLAHALKPYGYTSSFFHGGKNGTMGFDSFVKIAGFDEYAGKNEYPGGKADYDGTWGVFDEPFYAFFNQQLDKMPEPFLSVFFSLSSHHPYTIPAKYEGEYSAIESPFLKSLAYADYALSTFFEEAKKSDWFENTVFVITADHTAGTKRGEYRNLQGIYRIPLAFYIPGDSLFKPEVLPRVTQQIDILPSVLDLVHYPDTFAAWGNSVFRSEQNEPFAINYYNAFYQWIDTEYLIAEDFKTVPRLYKYSEDNGLQYNRFEDEPEKLHFYGKRLRAFLQLYSKALIENTLNEYENEQEEQEAP